MNGKLPFDSFMMHILKRQMHLYTWTELTTSNGYSTPKALGRAESEARNVQGCRTRGGKKTSEECAQHPFSTDTAPGYQTYNL